MIQASASETKKDGCMGDCGTGQYRFNLPAVSEGGTRAIIGRMDTPSASVESRYLTDKETKKLEQSGRVGSINNVQE